MFSRGPSTVNDSDSEGYGSAQAMPNVPDAPGTSPGESEIDRSSYARRRRALLKLLGDLHRTGVQNVLPLPQIAVLGSQSVGKSSLIESISGVRLPRDTGTCTRCPMECKLTNAPGQWCCKVTLRFQVDESGADLAETREVSFGSDILSPDHVERRLRQAQRALLRPYLAPSAFLDDSDLNTTGAEPLSFTANCVCVDISGPAVTDLHFYDLPGIIANVKEGQQSSDIELVQSLAWRYIKKPGCIILLVVSCDTDFENQGAGRMARQIDPRGHNTVGVLTKPDRAESETVAKWQRINNDLPLESGWFVLKLPNPAELKAGIPWDEAKRAAERFFQSDASWKDYAAQNARRVGTENLTEYLSSRLSDQLNKEIPKLRDAIADHITEIKRLLSQLPPEFVGDPSHEVFGLVQKFSRDVTDHVRGLTGAVLSPTADDGLVQRLRAVFGEFKVAIRHTTPLFNPRRTPLRREGASGGDGGVSLIHARRSLTIPDDGPAEEGIRPELADIDSDGDDMAIDIDDNPSVPIRDVMIVAQKARTRELPGNVPFAVKESYIKAFLEKWPAPSHECFENSADIYEEILKHLLRKHFSKYEYGGLLDSALDSLQVHLDRVRIAAREALSEQLRVETGRLYTQNEHYFFDYKAKMLCKYKDLRRTTQAKNLSARLSNIYLGSSYYDNEFRIKVNSAITALAALDISVSPIELAKLLPADPMDQALDIMAEVRAYFQVAYKRVIDVVPLTIERELITAADDGMAEALLRGLDLTGDSSRTKCANWVREPRAVAQERAELQGRARILNDARSILARHV